MTGPKHNEYFEGILQLRNPSNKLIDTAIKEIEKKEDANIAKVKKVANGVDIYISSQRFLRTLGNKLQNQFGGQLIISTKLHTKHRLTSRELYRVNVLFRLPNFKKGDVITYRGDKIKIITMHKNILAKDMKTGKKRRLSFKDLN
jgi:nonsense-mediated mRNA decay protein 3